jgi:hypothetical protein
MKKSTLLIALLGFAKIMMSQNAAIEAFLSTPFITNLTISSKSDKIAWVENERGERNIFLAEKPNYINAASPSTPKTMAWNYPICLSRRMKKP